MKPRFILVLLGLSALTLLSLGLQAQDRPTPASSKSADKDDLVTDEQQLARQFADFQDKLLRLKQKLARGTSDEKKKAEVIDKVLEECKNLAINQEFAKMLEILRTAKLTKTDELATLKDQSEILARRLRQILDMLQNSDTDRLSQQRKDLEQLIKDLQKAIDQQKTVRAQTDLGKTDKKELEKTQGKVTDNTNKVEKGIEKYLNKDGKGGETANLKGENKDGKGEGKKGEAKDAGAKPSEIAKQGESRDAGKDSKGPKGEAKAGDKSKENVQAKSPSKAGEPKANAKEPGKESTQVASAKESKNGPKGQQGSAKDNKSGPAKEGSPKEGSAKDSGARSNDKTQPKTGSDKGVAKGEDKKPGAAPENKATSPVSKDDSPSSNAKAPGESAEGSPQASNKNPKTGGPPSGGDSKSGEAKGGDARGSQASNQGKAKSGQNDGQAQAKDGGSAAPNNPNDPASQQAANKSDGDMPPPSGGAPSPPKQNDDVAQSHKKVKEAGYDQKIAEQNIAKQHNAQASKNQADAIKKMEEAKKKLERLLQQLRDDEQERVLAALQARCEKMLIMQIQVLVGTEDVDKAVTRNQDKKATRENKQASLKLSDEEKFIVQEANKCIDILEAEGSAVAFPEVFQQVRQDMIHVQKRLELTDVHDVTQGIERDIIETLKEMIEALKKARQEMQPSPPGQPAKAGKPGDQKLLELIQELKMVRSLQKRVNDRTELYGRRFPGEQANDPQIIRELRSLGDRQLRIQDIVSRIAKGDNK